MLVSNSLFFNCLIQIPKSRSEGSIQGHRVLRAEPLDCVPHISLWLSRRKPSLEAMYSTEDACDAKWLPRLVCYLIYMIHIALATLM